MAGEIAWIQLTDIRRGVMIRHIFSAKVIDCLSTQSAVERGSEAGFEAKSPFTIIWLFASIVLGLLLLATFSLGSLSAARAYVGGESMWSKAQKDAVFHLQK